MSKKYVMKHVQVICNFLILQFLKTRQKRRVFGLLYHVCRGCRATFSCHLFSFGSPLRICIVFCQSQYPYSGNLPIYVYIFYCILVPCFDNIYLCVVLALPLSEDNKETYNELFGLWSLTNSKHCHAQQFLATVVAGTPEKI